jgi:predicted RNA-binding protein with PUA domain
MQVFQVGNARNKTCNGDKGKEVITEFKLLYMISYHPQRKNWKYTCMYEQTIKFHINLLDSILKAI